MASHAVVVLGDDDLSIAFAGSLTHGGHRVVLWVPPSARATQVELSGGSAFTMAGIDGERDTELDLVTDDPFEALAAGDVVLSCGPPHTQAAMAGLILPLIEARHTLALLPGSLGSLHHAKWLRDRGRDALPTLVESDVAPLLAYRPAPGYVRVAAVAAQPGLGVFPAARTTEALAELGPLLPQARAHRHVLSAALAECLPMVRTAALLLNAALAERRHPCRTVLEDGFTPGVARVAEALDRERLALAAAVGLDLPTAAESLHLWGLGPRGDLWATVNGSYALSRTPQGGEPLSVRLAADDTIGLRTWAELADQLGVPMPLTRALVTLAAAAAGAGSAEVDRSLEDLGVAGMGAAQLERFLDSGDDSDGS